MKLFIKLLQRKHRGEVCLDVIKCHISSVERLIYRVASQYRGGGARRLFKGFRLRMTQWLSLSIFYLARGLAVAKLSLKRLCISMTVITKAVGFLLMSKEVKLIT